MVLAFDSTSKFGEAVFGSTSSQTAGANGAIAQHNPSATAPAVLKGGRSKRRSQRQNQRRSQRQNQRRSQRQNQRRSQRQNGGRNNKSRRQRGGK